MSPSRTTRGVVAAGHPVTADAACAILAAGGNAFDAVLAAMLSACVAEPVLASLGGGGFLLAHPADGPPEVFDFFVQTPRQRRALDEIEFQPILADFGTAQQEFHIGMGTIATPGLARGLFAVHDALGSMPLALVAEPAITAARDGVVVNAFQHYIATIVAPILHSRSDALALHASSSEPGRLAAEGERLKNPVLADTIDALAREGAALFYTGEIGDRIARDCRQAGGWLGAADLRGYEVIRRPPLATAYHGHRLFLNPPPAVGGTLLAFTMGLLAGVPAAAEPVSDRGLLAIAEAMSQTQGVRRDQRIDFGLDDALARRLLDPLTLAQHRKTLEALLSTRGTTHVSVADSAGNLASLTLSNGEGSGYVVPGTGIMLNNMLGEEDLNARGFHEWPTDVRVASMMSPTLAETAEGTWLAVGSGGSNRIRSAILQTLLHQLDGGLDVEQAVRRPRIHVENGQLNAEAGFGESAIALLRSRYRGLRIWPDINLFFGGAHTVLRHADGSLAGAGDPRRGGVARFA